MLKYLVVPAFLAAVCTLNAAPAPDFTITDSDGNTRQLYADFVNQGKVVVLEIFFISCPPCATHAPHWQTLYTNMKAQYGSQVEFIMLSNKSGDTNAAVAQYKTSKGLTMPAAGSNGGSLTAVQPYESGQFEPFYGTPTFVVIKPGTGEVVFDVRGGSASSTMNLISQEIALLLQIPKCRIHTHQGDTLKNYTLTVAVPDGPSVTKQITDGGYSLEDFPGLPPLPFYQAIPDKNNDPLNGVSTFDLVQINKQILGIEPFQHPWQFVAGDANGSGSLTTFDIVELRKLILGVYDSLPNVDSWVFSPAFDTISPLECPNFYAIKKGDVNGNADPAGLKPPPAPRGSDIFPLLVSDQRLEAGQTYRIPIMAGVGKDLLGMQLALHFDASVLEILSVESGCLPGFGPECRHLKDGRLSVSWFDADPFQTRVFEPLITLEIMTRRSGRVGDLFTVEALPLRAEVYRVDGQLQPVELQVSPAVTVPALIWPNPARRQFVVHLPPAYPVDVLQIIDLQGRLVYEQPPPEDTTEKTLLVTPGPLPAGLYAVRMNGHALGLLHWQP